MSTQTLLTPSIITKETLRILENNLVAAGKVTRKFENQFVKIGQTLTVRKPNRFTVTKGPGIAIQNIVEPSTSITISNQAHVDFQFSSQDLTLVIEEFSERYCKPAAAEIANQIDIDVLALTNQVYNFVGTAASLPSNFNAIAAVGQQMDRGAVPQADRTLILGPDAYWNIATGLVTNILAQSVTEPAFKGFLARLGNFDIYLDQNIMLQTVGNYSGSGVVNGASQTGASLVTNGWTASVTGLLNVGDVFTLSGVNAVNPKSRVSTGQLQRFVVTATVNSDSGGNATIAISPAIVTSGAYQNVTGSPANLSAIVVLTGAALAQNFNNIGFTPECFGLVTVPLEVYQGQDFCAREMYKGISMRIWRQPDITNDVCPCRIDVLYGVACFYPEMGVRLTN